MVDNNRYNIVLPYMNQLEKLVGMDIDDFSDSVQCSYEFLQRKLGKEKLVKAELLLDQVSEILWGE